MKVKEEQEYEMLIPPRIFPNFIHAHSVGGNANITRTYVVSEFTEQQAIEYGEELKQGFIQHWRNKLAQQSKEDQP